MIRLLHGDCLAMLKEVEPGSVDLILCDPPYSSGGTHAGDRKASTTAKYTDNDFNGASRLPAFSGDNMDQRSFTAFMRWVCSELRQKTREGGILEMFVVWCSNGDLPIDWKAAKGTKAMPGVYHVPIVAPKQRFHQTEKPVELLESLLAICTPGGTVLDAFMGSGSTGVAAVKTGRSFIGMELSNQYFDTATKRIQEAEDELLNDF